jgi:hypothetical protein
MYEMGLNEDSVYNEVICFLVLSGAKKPLTVRLRNLLLRVEIGAAAEEQERTVEGA